MHLRSQSFRALALAEQPKGWQRFIRFNLLHLLLMFVASQTLPWPLAGTSQVETCEAAGGSAPRPSAKTPCESLGTGLRAAGTPRGAGAGGPRNGVLTRHQPETSGKSCCGQKRVGAQPGQPHGRAPVSVGAASAEAVLGPRVPHPVGQDIPGRPGDPAQGSRVSRLSQGSCLVSASLALPQQIK